MEYNPCEAISKKTYLPCKLQARQGAKTCHIHKDFFNDTWKEYFLFQRPKCLYVIYHLVTNYQNLNGLCEEARIGSHIRKVLQEKLVTVTIEDIQAIPTTSAYIDVFLYILEMKDLEITDFPEMTACLLSTFMNYTRPLTRALGILEFKIKPFLEHPSLQFAEKLLLICTLATEILEEKKNDENTNEFTTRYIDDRYPDFNLFLNEVFKYYKNEFDNESKEEVKKFLIRFPTPEMDKFFEEYIIPRLPNLK